MKFEETYFRPWRKAIQDALEDRLTHARIRRAIRNPERSLTDIIRSQDDILRQYALEWADISNNHMENGVYRNIAEFIGDQKGLLIDLCCGNGNFIAEWGKVPAVGVDLNGYCLQLAERNIEQKGLPVKRYSKSTLSFNKEMGFEVKPSEGELYLEGITLLNDDITNLDMTRKILKDKGVKADLMTFTLWGGRDVYTPIHFLDPNIRSYKHYHSQAYQVYSLAEKLPELLNPNGRFYVAVRWEPRVEQNLQAQGKTVESMYQSLVGNIGRVTRVASFPLHETGISSLGKTDYANLKVVEIVVR